MAAVAFETGTLHNATPIPPPPPQPTRVFFGGGGGGSPNRVTQPADAHPRMRSKPQRGKPKRLYEDEDDDLESLAIGNLAVSDTAKGKKGQRVRLSFGGEAQDGAANDNAPAKVSEPDRTTPMIVGSIGSLALLFFGLHVRVAILPLVECVLVASLPKSNKPEHRLPAWVMLRS